MSMCVCVWRVCMFIRVFIYRKRNILRPLSYYLTTGRHVSILRATTIRRWRRQNYFPLLSHQKVPFFVEKKKKGKENCIPTIVCTREKCLALCVYIIYSGANDDPCPQKIFLREKFATRKKPASPLLPRRLATEIWCVCVCGSISEGNHAERHASRFFK